jgi:hypothetical protein
MAKQKEVKMPKTIGSIERVVSLQANFRLQCP